MGALPRLVAAACRPAGPHLPVAQLREHPKKPPKCLKGYYPEVVRMDLAPRTHGSDVRGRFVPALGWVRCILAARGGAYRRIVRQRILPAYRAAGADLSRVASSSFDGTVLYRSNGRTHDQGA